MKASEQRIQLLTEIALGSDRSISPGDRIRALQALHEMDSAEIAMENELERATDDELYLQLDAATAVTVAEILSGDPLTVSKYPNTARIVRAEIDRRVGELVRERALLVAEEPEPEESSEGAEPEPDPEPEQDPETERELVTAEERVPDFPPKAWQLDSWPDEPRGRLRR